MLLKIKIKIILLNVFVFLGLLLLGAIFNKFIEIGSTFILFYVFRSNYTKTYHADTLYLCSLYTLLIFLILCLINLPMHTSIGFTIIFVYLTTNFLYIIADYKELLKTKEVKVYRGMNRDVLTEKCKMYNLNDLETSILIMYYCDKLKRWQIGNILNYSEDRISQIKKSALDKFV